MSVYRGAVCKLCRRERRKLFLKGSRCLTAKCAIEKRDYPPGQHGRGRFRESEYNLQLREKQKVKRTLFMTEKQFRRFYAIAEKMEGSTGENLLINLERRLDNIVKRLGLASGIQQARQLVLHRNIMVNGRVTNIPSYMVNEGDVIAVREKSRELEVIKSALEENQSIGVPDWLTFDADKMTGEVNRFPTRDEITLAGGDIQENLIAELYSK
ncbi:MAG: 30S ribosomal protein S4 [Elusimicrobia bacterium]|nr:30S ribosomal protein S4 [Elusimicrobiota bacterium]